MAKYKIIPSSRTIVQSPISIGHKAEKGVEAIEFDLTAWVGTYGSGTATIIMRRWGDAIPYPIALEIDENNKATWTLSDIDTAKAGMAYAQLNYIVGDEVVKKSDIYTFRVMDSLTGEGEPPEAYESWLEHLTHFAAEAMAEVLDIEGIVTDKTLTVDGGIADAKAVGDELTGIKANLGAMQPAMDLVWTIGKTINSSGVAGDNARGAMSVPIAVSGGGRIIRISNGKGNNNELFIIHVCQYVNGVFQSRTSVPLAGVALDDATTSITFNCLYASTSSNIMSQEDINNYFDVLLYQPSSSVASERYGLKNIAVDQNEVTSVYNGVLTNLPVNTFMWTNGALWSDSPVSTGFFYVFTLSGISKATVMPNSAQAMQMAILPDNNETYTRRIKSGAWTDWVSGGKDIRTYPVYYAYGDSFTWGAVWDSDPETPYYQAELNEQIPTRVANAIGSKTWHNIGVSGARFVKQEETDYTIGQRIKDTDLSDADLITIGGGRNDSATSLGSLETSTANDGTICGAMIDIFDYLTSTYPKLQIIVYGPTPQPHPEHLEPRFMFDREFSGGWSNATYYEEVGKICKTYGIPFIDWRDCTLMYRFGGLTGGYNSGRQNYSHPLEGDTYRQCGNFIAGRVASYYTG